MAIQQSTTNHYHIYVIELNPQVLQQGRFAEMNPGYTYRPDRPPLYVGMTGRTPEIRLEQHKSGYKASRYTKRNTLWLRLDLVSDIGPLIHDEAMRMEVERAEALRARGYAVWQN